MEQDVAVNKRDHALDGVRGIACLIVFLSHFMQFFLPSVFFQGQYDHFGESSITATPFNILYNGQFAVMLFFVLSGMVLAMPFFSGKNDRWYSTTLIKRYPRLALPAIASTLFAFCLMYFIGFHQIETGPYSLSTLIPKPPKDPSFMNALWEGGIGSFFYKKQTFNPVLWTIGIELIGSVVVLVLTPLFCRTKYRFLFYILGIFVLSNRHLIGFILGIICADISKNVKRFHPALTPLLLMFGIYFGAYPYYLEDESIWMDWKGVEYADMMICSRAFGSMLIILAIDKSKFIGDLFSSKICKFFGGVSYSLYLVHFPILASIGSLIVVKLCQHGFGYGHSLLIAFPISFTTSMLIACAFKILIDDKSILLAKIIAEKIYPR